MHAGQWHNCDQGSRGKQIKGSYISNFFQGLGVFGVSYIPVATTVARGEGSDRRAKNMSHLLE